MASFDPDAPDRDSADYVSYLSDKIAEEEQRLKSLQDKCRITTMEEQIASLRLQYIYVYIYIYIYVYIYIYICMYVCMYLCMYVYMYIYIILYIGHQNGA